MKINTLLFYTAIIISFSSLVSCHKKEKTPEKLPDGNYYSIVQFTQDQWATFRGTPLTLVKTVTANGKTDSIYVQADTLDWAAIFKIFFATDISDRKFLNHYNFSLFMDETTESRNFYYEAKDPDLFTRKLLISSNDENNHIKSIYIETARKNFWGSTYQKLYYKPMKLLQIQETSNPLFSSKKEEVTEYRFMIDI